MDRIERLKEALARDDLDAIALAPGPTLRYVTGAHFMLTDRLFLLIVPVDGTPAVIVPNLEQAEWAASVSFDAHVFPWDDVEGPDYAIEQAANALPQLSHIGVEPLGLRYMEVACLQRHFKKSQLNSGENAVTSLRIRKSVDEIENIRTAARIAEAALEDTLRDVKPGIQERQIAAKLSSLLLAHGGEGISFGPIVLSGPKSALPHGVPGDRAVQPGELLLIDFGTAHAGYHCDITRTFVVGAEPNDRTREVYEAVRLGNEHGREACRPGATPHDIHHATQDHLHQEPFTEFFKHRTGHGLGLDVHEPPSIMDGATTPLEPGEVFTIEPGLYLEGFGGVRIEDDIAITERGADTLTVYPRELKVIGND